VWGLILSLTQHVSDYARMVSNGSWTQNELQTVMSHPIRELDGRIFGVVGWGELGRGTARAPFEGRLTTPRVRSVREANTQPLACFFSLFAARFSSSVLVGFFFSSFFRSIPLPMIHSSFS
jgi:hypothetical protein